MRSTTSFPQLQAPIRWTSYLPAVAALGIVASGWFQQPTLSPRLSFPILGSLLVWLGWELYQGIAYFWRASRENEPMSPWRGLGFALLASLVVLLQMTGGLYSPFYPILYLAIAFLASIGHANQGATWFGYAILLELAIVIASGIHQPGVVGRGALHLLLLGLFAGSHHLYLHAFLRSANPLHRLANEKRTESKQLSPQPGVTKLSMDALEDDQRAQLSLLKEGLDAHGCALLWQMENDSHYEVIFLETDASDYNVGPFSIHTGALAPLFKGRTSQRLRSNGKSRIHLPYYSAETAIRSILAAPIQRDGVVRGILCADRTQRAPFSAREEAILESAAIAFSRALESERSYQQSDRDFQSLRLLHEAGQQLNEARTEAEIAQKALDAAQHFMPYDWGFVARYHEASGSYTLLAATDECATWMGHELPLGDCLLTLALKHGCPLPKQGILRGDGPYLTEKEGLFPTPKSLYIVPLMMKQQPVGCLVIASEQTGAFASREPQTHLGALAHQTAALLENASYTQQLEVLAQHDGLTGLFNHRTFMERLQDSFRSARRHNRTLSLLLLDIDHFKQINDTYGHPVGDQVLRRVARQLESTVRDIDIAARYGGEEFVILLEETPSVGALKLADRLRKEIAQLEFFAGDDQEQMFQVTLSVGVANFPSHAAEPDTLIVHADQALYDAKRRGRNRVVLFSSSEEGQPQETPIQPQELDSFPPNGWGWGSLPNAEDPTSLSDPERWSWSYPRHGSHDFDSQGPRISSNPPEAPAPRKLSHSHPALSSFPVPEPTEPKA